MTMYVMGWAIDQGSSGVAAVLGLPNSSRTAFDSVVTGFHSAMVWRKPRHGLGGHEGAGHERDREDHREPDALHPSGVATTLPSSTPTQIMAKANAEQQEVAEAGP